MTTQTKGNGESISEGSMYVYPCHTDKSFIGNGESIGEGSTYLHVLVSAFAPGIQSF